jgi:acyl-ACP thioesterase
MFISAAQTDRFGRISIPAIAGILEDLAWRDANRLSFGYDELKERNLLWVLSRMKVKIYKRPNWREEIVGKTWACGVDGPFARREFRIENKDGELMIEAVSHWLVVDASTHRMVRINSILDLFKADPKSVIEWSTSKLGDVKADFQSDFRDVLYSDIDLNQHVNNARYLQRIIDSMSDEVIEKTEITGYEINFLNEAVLGDKLAVVRNEVAEGEDQLAAIIRESDGKETVRVKLEWKFRESECQK